MVPFSLPLLLLLRWVLFAAVQGMGSGYNDDHHGLHFPGEGAMIQPTDPCLVVSPPCVSEADRHSLEALRDIHRQVDDDQDGGIEVEESVEFIIEDMKQQQTHKHSNLHREDQHITVEELWRGWKSSEVHNWTQEEVLRWLREFVELPQYEKNFKEFRVNGNTLPRIAANEPSFLSAHLKIQDQRDKQKLNIKALDVVLFGPPTRPPHNWMKDLVLIVSVVMGVGGCWFAQAQNKTSKVHISKMMKDLESLQSAELSLQELQEQLERAQEEKRNVAEEKQNLEEKMRDEIMGAQEEAHRLHVLRKGAVSELSRLRYAEEELEQVRGALKRAEKDMQINWTVPEALQLWLQLTHEVEVQYYNVKKHSAELQLGTAKEEAEKINKKRSSVLGTLHVAHSSSLDQVDQKILEAKNALSDVTASLRERLHRWQHIERLCTFPILRNAGLVSLTATLYTDPGWVAKPRVSALAYSCHGSSVHGSEEDLLEATSSPNHSQMPAPPMKCSSGSHGSSVCRSRRTGHMTPTPSMISSDPDLLIPIRAPLPCFEEEEADIFINPQRRQECQEIFSDADLMGPSHLGRMYPSAIDSSSRKIFRDEMEMFADAPERKTSREELEASSEPPICKLSREELETSTDMRKMTRDKVEAITDASTLKTPKDKMESSMESTTSRKISRERGDAYLDATTRKTLRDELEASAERTSRKISRDSMGVSMDSASRKMQQEEFECSLDSTLRKITRDSMGLSLDLGSRKVPRDIGEILSESPMRGMPRDKMVDTIGTPMRRISRDELEFSADSVSRNMLPRDKTDVRMDASFRIVSREKPEFSAESSAMRKISRDELEMSASSHRRRLIRDNIDSSIDTPTGKISRDRVDVTMEIPKRRISREEFVAPEPVQPDLTLNPMVSWKPPSDPSRLVYDGILEKSVSTSTSTNPTGPSEFITTTFPQSMQVGEELHISDPSPNASPPERSKEKHKDKEKSKKTSKLKNLFRKKKDSTSERPPQSGLQKL